MALGRIMLFIGLLAALALVASALVGYGLFGPLSEMQPAHSLLGFGAVLANVFAHAWIVLFLGAGGWGRGRWAHQRGLSPAGLASAARARGWASTAAVLAALAFVGTFVLGNLALAHRVPGVAHHSFFFAALAFQAVALGLEARALQASDRVSAALDVPAGARESADAV
jgi:hypothetical protein